jgi:hypothetical protein
MDDPVRVAVVAAAVVIGLGVLAWLVRRAARRGREADVGPWRGAGGAGGRGARREKGAGLSGPRMFSQVRGGQTIRVDVKGERHEYDRLEDVPAEIRGRIEEMIRSGSGTQRIVLDINGRHYEFDSLAEVPEDLRRHLPPHLFGGQGGGGRAR